MSNMEINEILHKIKGMSAVDLDQLISTIKARRETLTKIASIVLKEGSRVSFVNAQGMTVCGSITKVNRKTALVLEPKEYPFRHTTWKVPLTLLNAQEE